MPHVKIRARIRGWARGAGENPRESLASAIALKLDARDRWVLGLAGRLERVLPRGCEVFLESLHRGEWGGYASMGDPHATNVKHRIHAAQPLTVGPGRAHVHEVAQCIRGRQGDTNRASGSAIVAGKDRRSGACSAPATSFPLSDTSSPPSSSISVDMARYCAMSLKRE